MFKRKNHFTPITRSPLMAQTGFQLILDTILDILDTLSRVVRSGPWKIIFPPGGGGDDDTGGGGDDVEL